MGKEVGPASRADLLQAGDERPPWRPSRMSMLAGAVALLLLAGTLGEVAWARRRAAERRLDGAAAAAVSLVVTDAAATSASRGTDVVLGVRNVGPQPVRLVAARIDFPGYRRVAVHGLLGPAATTDLHLPSTPACEPGLVAAGPRRLLLDVETERGTGRRLALPLLIGLTAVTVLSAAQRACGALPAAESLAVSAIAGAGSSRRLAVLHLRLANLSALPLQVQAINPGLGLTLTADPPLPVALPPHGAAVGLVLRVAVSDCPTVLARAARTADRPLGNLDLIVVRGAEHVIRSIGPPAGGTAAIIALAGGCRP